MAALVDGRAPRAGAWSSTAAAEVIDIGRELAAAIIDELEKPTPES
jgi:hypothetical protein